MKILSLRYFSEKQRPDGVNFIIIPRKAKCIHTEQLFCVAQGVPATPGSNLIDVSVDYRENDRILNREIQERSQLV
ncbi:MAG: hypothetical protein SH868_07485 [Bythopirellula sp.]|nr:hypothetical protein [Bythopirellula sp.]